MEEVRAETHVSIADETHTAIGFESVLITSEPTFSTRLDILSYPGVEESAFKLVFKIGKV